MAASCLLTFPFMGNQKQMSFLSVLHSLLAAGQNLSLSNNTPPPIILFVFELLGGVHFTLRQKCVMVLKIVFKCCCPTSQIVMCLSVASAIDKRLINNRLYINFYWLVNWSACVLPFQSIFCTVNWDGFTSKVVVFPP